MNWMLCLWDKKQEIEFNLQVFLALCCSTTFYQPEEFQGKECVEVLDKCSGLKPLLLNLEVVSVVVSYDPQCSQTISVQAAVQLPQQK